MQDQETKKRGTRAKKTVEQKADAIVAIEEETPEVKQEAAPTFTLDQVQKMIEEALKKHDEEKKDSPAPKDDGTVTLRFQMEVNDGNVLPLGPNGKFGEITGKSATIVVRHQDFVGEFRTQLVQNLLKSRNLIVVDGLTDAERKIYGVDYHDGEYLEPVIYERLIEMGDGVLDVFPSLNVTWQEMIATKFIEAFENHKLLCSRDCLLELNRITKKNYTNLPQGDARRKGAFYPIIHAMNAADEIEE